jgi:hypothetical protein
VASNGRIERSTSVIKGRHLLFGLDVLVVHAPDDREREDRPDVNAKIGAT